MPNAGPSSPESALKEPSALALALTLAFLAACSATTSSPTPTTVPASQAAPAAPVVPRAAQVSLGDLPGVSTTVGDDLGRLRHIYDERIASADGFDTPIGPGDVLEISVPAMSELRQTTVRVSGDGTITLPLLGVLSVAGMDEQELTEDLRQRLAKYMYNPQLSLLVKEYRSRQVGVLGAVAKPGLHAMSTPNDTILDMISEAGGLTPEATQRILFMPVEKVKGEEAKRLASQVPASLLSGSSQEQLLKAANPVIINLEEMDPRTQQVALAVPVRPGDTIIALGGGQVYVQGWVEKPGAYPLTRGLTLLGVIAAAGGPAYPADKSSVRILREGNSKEKSVLIADLERIGNGDSQDVTLREGDVIDVSSAGGKLAAYGVYHFFTNVIRVGASMPLF